MKLIRLKINKFLRKTLGTKNEAPKDSPRMESISGGVLQGARMLLDIEAAPWQVAMKDGVFDRFIYDWIGKNVSMGGCVVWDVGAHVGYHSMALARLVGTGGRVFAFEPNPYNAARMRQNIEMNPDVANSIAMLSIALSDQEGSANFVFSPRVDDGSSSGSGLENSFKGNPEINISRAPRMSVEMSTADKVVSQGISPAPALVKLDVEGAEGSVLLGAKDLLANSKPIIISEIHSVTSMFHVLTILSELKYRVQLLGEEGATSSRCHIVAF